jgi:2-methylcitrate dehydratase
MSAVNRAVSKSLRLQKTFTSSQAARSASAKSVLPLSGGASRASVLSAAPRFLSKASTASSFHTMASLQSAAAAPPKPSEGVGYDPEIKDIANYIHSYQVDSELAVD